MRPLDVKLVFALALGLCALVPGLRQGSASAASSATSESTTEWPATWHGKPLRPLAFSAVEQRFLRASPAAWPA